MSDEKNRCPSCQGTGWDETGSFAEQGHVECTDCGGTGRDVARAGVGCAGLVGASDAESEEPEGWCNPCGTLRGHKCWGHCIGTRIVGTNDMERIAPTSDIQPPFVYRKPERRARDESPNDAGGERKEKYGKE